ncbi:MAG: tRNA 2-thiouridine(34) synthase MnmA [Bacteroidales bacterium]|nr:MAG: tRNA 2-thiouridine(34) synthase MnmA [Bacteroidales bacterium]
MSRIVIGLSGGVDSSVAAHLLKSDGHDVKALFMKNWHDTTGVLKGDCPWDEDVVFAEMVAKKIGIPFHTVDLSMEYRERVVEYLFSEYEKGRTPNPDVLCNREIKFDLFVKEALKLGADYVATGHYCKKGEIKINGKIVYRLLSGKDKNKDQSYFLCQVSQDQLKMAQFPLGEMTKPEVRKIAANLRLATATRKDSQGICFVGKVDLPAFLQQKLKRKPGDIVEISASSKTWMNFPGGLPENTISDQKLDILTRAFSYNSDDGEVVGKHDGAVFFTIGQRKGLNVGGKKKPLFVIALNVKKNLIFAGQGHDHPGLNRKGLKLENDEIHWLRDDLKMNPGESRDMNVRIRYRQPLQKARMFARKSGLYIVFNQLQRGIAPGQFAVWYDGDELIGSGVIEN